MFRSPVVITSRTPNAGQNLLDINQNTSQMEYTDAPNAVTRHLILISMSAIHPCQLCQKNCKT
jgi:hypothetical protein